MLSFTATGRPCSGPRQSPMSSSRAVASARAGSNQANARTSDSRSPIASMNEWVTASHVTSCPAIMRARRVADNRLSGVFIGIFPSRAGGPLRDRI